MSEKKIQPEAMALAVRETPRTSTQERSLDRLAFEPQNWEQAINVAGALVRSRLLPATVDTPEKALAIIMTGREFGLTAMQSLRSMHVINGKTAMSADLIAGLVLSSGLAEYFDPVEEESSADRATYVTKRRGAKHEVKMSFSMEDAKKAQLLGNPTWTKYPRAMLKARCKAALARDVYPDVATGVYEYDEIDGAQTIDAHSAREPEPAGTKEEADEIELWDRLAALILMCGGDAAFCAAINVSRLPETTEEARIAISRALAAQEKAIQSKGAAQAPAPHSSDSPPSEPIPEPVPHPENRSPPLRAVPTEAKATNGDRRQASPQSKPEQTPEGDASGSRASASGQASRAFSADEFWAAVRSFGLSLPEARKRVCQRFDLRDAGRISAEQRSVFIVELEAARAGGGAR